MRAKKVLILGSWSASSRLLVCKWSQRGGKRGRAEKKCKTVFNKGPWHRAANSRNEKVSICIWFVFIQWSRLCLGLHLFFYSFFLARGGFFFRHAGRHNIWFRSLTIYLIECCRGVCVYLHTNHWHHPRWALVSSLAPLFTPFGKLAIRNQKGDVTPVRTYILPTFQLVTRSVWTSRDLH